MARTYKTQTVSIPKKLYDALRNQQFDERRYGSLTAFICSILDAYIAQNERSDEETKEVRATKVRRINADEQRKTA